MGPIIEAQGLERRFGDLVAVDGVDLAIETGEVFGFLGPNGAGKSTTVRMLTTLLKPTAGAARVAGYDVVRQAGDVRRCIGVALQDAAIDPLMTGSELVHLQAVLHGIPTKVADQRGKELLERVGLTAASDRRVGTYSGGMRRRLDLALSLVHEPEVLFLDEPTTGLDPMSRMALWEEVRDLNRERGTTVLLTTQYLEEADQLAGRIAIIDHGRIVKEGEPRALKDEVGSPTLMVEVEGDPLTAAEVLGRFGDERPSEHRALAIGLAGGAQQLTAVVRALDEAGVVVLHMELNAPTLDDVFAEATGRRLEGAAEGAEQAGEAAPGATAALVPHRPNVARQSLVLSRRAVLSIVRQPQVVFPSLFFPLFFAALNAAAFDRITAAQPEFAAQYPSFLDFLLPATVLQGVLFGSTQAGTEMANDIEMGFFDRLLASPVSRTSILVGRLAGGAALGAAQAVFFTVVLVLFGAEVSGVGAVLVLVVCSALLAVGIGGFGVVLGIRTGSAEAVQGAFPLIFVLMFTSSVFFPRELMTGWYETVATYNPISWILEALRDLLTIGWSTTDALVAVAASAGVAALAIVIALRALRRRLAMAG